MSTTETPLSETLQDLVEFFGKLPENTLLTYRQSPMEIQAFDDSEVDNSPVYQDGTQVQYIGPTNEMDVPNGPHWVVVTDPNCAQEEQLVVHITSVNQETEEEAPAEEQAETDPPPDLPGDPGYVPKTEGRIYSAEEVQAIVAKDQRQSQLAQTILSMEGQAQLMQAELNDLRGRIKEKHRELAEMAISPAQTKLDFGNANAPQAGAGDDRDHAILTPGERGAQAAAQGKGREDCPYDDSYPEWQEQWLAAFDAANEAEPRPWKGKENEMQMSRAGLTMEQCAELLAATDKLTWPASGTEIPKLDSAQRAVALFDRPHLIIDELTEEVSGRLGYVLAPLYTADEWTASGADIGDPVDRSTQPGFHDYQIHGVLCGRRVKSGAKKLIIGPERDFIHLVADEQPSEEDQTASEGENLFL